MACFYKTSEGKYILNKNIENEISRCKMQIQKYEEVLDKYKSMIISEIKKDDAILENYEPGQYKFTYIKETTSEKFDSKAFKKDNEELYNKYIKLSNVKESLRINEVK